MWLIFERQIILYFSVVKKITITLLAAIYLFSVIGVSSSSFYCCGVLKAVAFSLGSAQHAGIKTKIKDGKCCKTQIQSFKIKDKQIFSSVKSLKQSAPLLLLSFGNANGRTLHHLLFLPIAYQSNAPPLVQAVPVYTLHCTYRI